MAEMLDISIKSVDKVLTSTSKIQEFLTTSWEVSEKADGIKISLIRLDTPFDAKDYTKNWIISYKNTIIFPEEIDFGDDEDIRKNSKGNAQFKFLHQHLKKIHPNTSSIPKNTELFIEYLMRKNTLSSDYTYPHKMILLAYSPCSYTIKNGAIRSKPSGFYQDKLDKYASTLNLNTPPRILDGKLYPTKTLEKSIVSDLFRKEFKNYKKELENSENNVELYYNIFVELVRSVESFAGGVPEGLVFQNDDTFLKIQKIGQTDPKARQAIKDKGKADPEIEEQYWELVRNTAKEILDTQDYDKPLALILQDCVEIIKNLKIDYNHPKKTQIEFQEDVLYNTRMAVERYLKGNRGALIIGKFRVLSNMHYKLINDCFKKFDTVTVCLVTGKDTKFSEDLRRKMLEKAFGSKIELITHSSGNIYSLLGKAQSTICTICAGSDRIPDYKKITDKILGLDVYELPRTDAGISATKIIANIEDEEYFKENTPKQIHSMYKEILKTYS